MKITSVTLMLVSTLLAACTSAPPRPKHVSAETYHRVASSGATYLGEAEDHAFLDAGDGNIVYSDTADLPEPQRAKVLAAGKTYTGRGSKVRRH